MAYSRGDVVKGPDLFADYDYRPYVCLSDDTHPFSEEEALYTSVTTTRRSLAIQIAAEHFESGGLPRESYVNPWTIVVIQHANIDEKEGRLKDPVVERVAREAASYLGV